MSVLNLSGRNCDEVRMLDAECDFDMFLFGILVVILKHIFVRR